ncbi:MAG: ABC transporter ATP-binding protein [Desulfitobacteriaceae bacterium]
MKDRQTLLWLYKNSKAQLFPMLALIFSNAAFSGCGILFALACRSVIDSAAAGEKSALPVQGLGLFAVILLQLILRILCRNLEVRIQGRLEMTFKAKLFGEILRKDYVHTIKYHSGELMNRLTGDIAVTSEGLTALLPNLVGLVTKMSLALAVLYIFDPLFALIFACGGLALFFGVRFFRGKLKGLHKRVQEQDGAVRSFMQEILENILVVKTFGVETEMQAKAEGSGQEHYKAKLKKNTFSILANSGVSLAFSMGYLYALLWSAFGLAEKTISFGTLTAILQLAAQVQTPLSGLSGLIPMAYSVMASAERIMELENLPEEWETNQRDIHVQAAYEKTDSLFFKDVSFGYDRELVFSHADLTINKGDFVIVSGLSGIGKSTLCKLLLGVFAPTAGIIGLKLHSGEQLPMDRYTRKLFAYVPQGSLLLSGTIRENISLVKPQATEEEIMAAAEVGCAAEFISTLPDGLNTVIGEKGKGLSEGQVQRLAIARAILSGSPILLLDEATSALDEATEKKLIYNIRNLAGKTCILISHKKTALSVCDKEIRIENGSLVTVERRRQHAAHTA